MCLSHNVCSLFIPLASVNSHAHVHRVHVHLTSLNHRSSSLLTRCQRSRPPGLRQQRFSQQTARHLHKRCSYSWSSTPSWISQTRSSDRKLNPGVFPAAGPTLPAAGKGRIHPSIHLSIRLPSSHPPNHPSIQSSICPPNHPSIQPSINPTIHLSMCLSIHPSIHLSVCI